MWLLCCGGAFLVNKAHDSISLIFFCSHTR